MVVEDETTFEPGDLVVRSSTGESGYVVRVHGGSAVVSFIGGKRTVFVSDLAPAPADPIEKLLDGVLDRFEAFGLGLAGRYIQHAYRFDPLSGLTNARIEPQHHQVYVAHRVLNKPRPRMILADEVGLGKTIEAGLIVKELIARRVAERVLIVCPASLQRQWQYELAAKFNEEFTIVDSAGLKFLGRADQNPWTKVDRAITSLTLVSREERMRDLIDAGWDVVVFDEAHRVRRRYEGSNRSRATRAYQLAEELESGVSGLLLLTATPMQLHPFELFSLIELVEPGLFPSFEAYETRRHTMPSLNQLMQLLRSWDVYPPDDRVERIRTSSELLEGMGIPSSGAVDRLADPEVRAELIEELIRKHPLTEVMVRNRKAQLGWTDRREAIRHLVPLTDEERERYEAVTAYIGQVYDLAIKNQNRAVGFLMALYQKMLASSTYAIWTSLNKRHAKLVELREQALVAVDRVDEEELEELAEAEEPSEAVTQLEERAVDPQMLDWEISLLGSLLGRLAEARDSKLKVLIRDIVDPLLEGRDGEKIVIFTGFRNTQKLISEALRHRGYRVATFHGGLSLDEKERAVANFRDLADVLVTTEAGGEGRNFQFAHIMVNYDLPWNPMRVEQRIGRLDRIGQRHRVLIYNLALAGTIEERVLDVLENRIELFRESVGALEPILGEIETDLVRLVLTHRDRLDENLDLYVTQLDQRIAAAKETEEMLADFVLDEASLRRDTVNELLQRPRLATHEDLRAVVAASLAYHGGALTHGGDIEEIALSPHLETQIEWPRPTTRGLFDPAAALQHEETEFFAMGHELIDRLVVLASEVGATTTAYRDVSVPAGETLVEFYYELETSGFRSEGRFVRHRVGRDLRVRSKTLTRPPRLGRAIEGDVPTPPWAEDAAAASRERLLEELRDLQAEVSARHEAAKEERIERLQRVYEYRERRLNERIAAEQRTIATIMEEGTESQQRVLPARRGRLRRIQDELKRLPAERAAEIHAIQDESVQPSSSELAAAIVLGAER